MAQQTAVEWLYERFLFAGYAAPSEWKEQAKQMEKEQIVKAWELRATPYPTEGMGYSIIDATGEQYYNETYGENKD